MSGAPDPVAAIARAVLYEGYVLWPYRRSALKNARRWTFGGVHPPAHAREHPDDRATMRTQVLVAGPATAPLEVAVRFLHVLERRPLDAHGQAVDALVAGGETHLAWDEAREREVTLSTTLCRPATAAIDVAAGRDVEALGDAGSLVRTWEPLRATVRLGVEALSERLHRVTVDIANTTPFEGGDREAALRRTLVSTHTVLRTADAELISLTDPPDDLRAAAEACANDGTWPVLVGDAHVVLSSPIILSDHPEIAPESPGDLFDGGEIDQLLILNVLSLTDSEREEARATDPRAREILDRCAGLSHEELMALHGTIRDRNPMGTW